MTELCQLEGFALKWQLASFGAKVGYFGHLFLRSKISTSNLLPEIYIKIDRKNKLEVNRTQNDNFSFQKAT